MPKPQKKKFDQANFAKKSFGQNFLNNAEIRDDIVALGGEIAEKNILEIGPGLGFLTSKLLSSKAKLTAVELDQRALDHLARDFGHKENFNLINDDILKIDLDEMYKDQEYAIIANIPYNITNPILRKITEKSKNRPQYAILMVQKEVGEKICNQKKKSILSIAVEVYAQTDYAFTVLRDNFTPAPRVDSCIIKLNTRKEPLVPDSMIRDFFTVVNGGFSEKRKKLSNVIPKFFGVGAPEILGDIDPNRRAETLSVDEWIYITERFQKVMKTQ